MTYMPGCNNTHADSADNALADPLADLIDSFELIDDWEDRYRLILDLGKKIPPLPDADRTDATRVHGCQSSVWLIAQRNAEAGTIAFIADSDSHIVRGLIAILQQAYSNQTPQHILSYPIDTRLATLGLDAHLSPTRRNGLFEMVKRIKQLASSNG